MNCEKCKELLVAYVEELLEEPGKRSVAEHLKDCPSCQSQAQELRGLHNRLIKNGKALAREMVAGQARSDLENNVMNRIVQEQNVRLKAAQRATEALKTRRTIMKSPITRIAAAAALIVVAALGISYIMTPSVTWAQVVEPILNAKTILFDLAFGLNESNPASHEIIVDSRIRRTMPNLPNMVMILDLDGGKMLALDTASKTATYVDIQGDLQNRTQQYVRFLRETIRLLKENADIEKLGEKMIDGQKAVGFIAKSPNESVTIWADPKTARPLRIEAQLGQEFAFIMKNFELDAPVDESLVSMEVPPGYTLQKNDIAMGNATEADFIDCLRIWATVLGDGVFPDTIGTETTMKQMPALIEKMKAMDLSEEEGSKMGMKIGLGMMFHQIIDTRGDDWKYVGAGVKSGDANKAIFWYQPKGSATYRVIYGDLSVKDVAAENLPK